MRMLTAIRERLSSRDHRWELVGELVAGQYEVLSPLGTSHTGRAYLARERSLDRTVVIKFVHRAPPERQAKIMERFRREARALSRLNHPHVAQLHAFGQAEDGRPFLVTEYVDGRPLEKMLERFAWLPEARVLPILDQICAGLEEAHGAGLVHRNLKPANVMIAERRDGADFVKLVNFGVARLPEKSRTPRGHEERLTAPRGVCGTPRYLSPEQARGLDADARADIYAVGLIGYEMLAGRPPFDGENAVSWAYKHAKEPAPPASERAKNHPVHPVVEALLARCLEKRPEDRFQSATELRLALAEALSVVRAAGKPVQPLVRRNASRDVPAVKARPEELRSTSKMAAILGAGALPPGTTRLQRAAAGAARWVLSGHRRWYLAGAGALLAGFLIGASL